MVKLIIALISGIAGSVLGYMLLKQSKKNQNALHSLIGLITLLSSIFGSIVVISFLLLKEEYWSGENTELFGIISILSITVPILFLGLKILLKGKKENANLLLYTGGTWMGITLICSFLSIQYVIKVNNGWTYEAKNKLLLDCDKEARFNPDSKLNCYCYLENTIKMFPDPEDYNKAMGDESSDEYKEHNNVVTNCDEKPENHDF